MFCLPLPPADTGHIHAFMIGTDVGELGEREFESETTGRFSRDARQGASLNLRYKFLDRETAAFGLTSSAETHGDRIEETTVVRVRSVGTDVTLAVEREIIPNVVTTLNLTYQPEWTHFAGAATEEQELVLVVALGVMAQFRPGFLLGGEVRYFRKYDGIGLEELAGQALFIGPTAYFPLSERSRLDRELEHLGLGASGRNERRARSRQFRASSGETGVGSQRLEQIRKSVKRLFEKVMLNQESRARWRFILIRSRSSGAYGLLKLRVCRLRN